MSGNDFPDAVIEAVEYARAELEKGFAPDPSDHYTPTGKWDAGTHGSRKTYTGHGVHLIRDEHTDTPGDEKWKVEVKMASRTESETLLIEDDLSVDEMQNLMRAFQYRLNWSVKQGDYDPSYD